jgi:hypothetical protein
LLSLCSKLEHLDLSDTQVSDLSTIGNLYNLHSLSLIGLAINDIDIIRNLPKLQVLDVLDANDTNRDKLAQIDNLRIRHWNKLDQTPFYVEQRTNPEHAVRLRRGGRYKGLRSRDRGKIR